MKFLIDAQLPSSLCHLFSSRGHDGIHTSVLPFQNETPDNVINAISIADQRVLITKDADFLDSFLIKHEPFKLILIKLGNTSKTELVQFFTDRFDEIIEKIVSEDIILLTK